MANEKKGLSLYTSKATASKTSQIIWKFENEKHVTAPLAVCITKLVKKLASLFNLVLFFCFFFFSRHGIYRPHINFTFQSYSSANIIFLMLCTNFNG